MKPSPHSAIQRSMVSGEHSRLTPRAASTSAEPDREETERLPCLATGTPAPATTKAVHVEMLCVPLASPPVPHVSMAPTGARTDNALARSTRAAPAISSTVSPRACMPIRSAPICTSVAPPDIMTSKVRAASVCERVSPAATFLMAARRSSGPTSPAGEELEGTDGVSLSAAPRPPLDAGKVEEIGEQLMPVLRGDALGMKLDAVDGVTLVLHAHDDAVRRLRGDFQILGKRVAVDHERVIARRREVLGEAGEHALAGVVHLGQLAVHQIGRPHHAPAIDLTDGLMAETDTQDGHDRACALDQLEANTGAVRIARPRRQHDSLRPFRQHLVHGHLVVAIDLRARAQFPKEMNEVVGEAVVVIDQGQHGLVLRLVPIGRQVQGSRAHAVPLSGATGSGCRH